MPWPDGPVVVRSLDSLEYSSIDATKSPAWRQGPQFSPDGNYLSYIDGNGIVANVRPLLKAPLSGGPVVKLA